MSTPTPPGPWSSEPPPGGTPSPYPPPYGQPPPSPYGTPPASESPYGAPSPYGGSPAAYGTSPYGPPLPTTPPTKGMAITAFVLGVLPCIPFALIISPVLAIVVLVRSRKGGDHGKGWAIAALAAVAAWLALGISLLVSDTDLFEELREATKTEAPRDAEGTVTEATEISPSDLEVGDCVIDESLVGATEAVETLTVEVLPCGEPHFAEVYHDFVLAEGDYPGDKAVERKAALGCVKKFKGFVGLGYAPSKLELYYYMPREQSWKLLDDRKVSCMVSEETGTTVGSLEGVRR